MQMPGEKGMDDMQALMAKFRAAPPQNLGGLKLVRMRDYQNGVILTPDGKNATARGELAANTRATW